MNYVQLEELHQKYSSKGLSILAFPCNQFGQQEPGSNAEIKKFAHENYHVHFDMFAKIDVNGDCAAPLYKYLKSHKNGRGTLTNAIKWNFTKFLVDRQGVPAARFGSNVDPKSAEIVDSIEKLL